MSERLVCEYYKEVREISKILAHEETMRRKIEMNGD